LYSHVKKFFLLNNAFNKFLNYQNFSSLINIKPAKICLIDLSVKRRVTGPINILDKKLNCSEKTLQEGWIKMKKILIVFFCMIIVSTNIFAQSDLQGNGNGGKDKIGGWLGFPIVGLSYSHEFNDLMEFDLLVGVTGLPVIARQLNIRSGVLFTVWDPVLKGQKCPLTIGAALDINSYMVFVKPTSIGMSLVFPIRWEINFGKVPKFNMFIEAAPLIGFSYSSSGVGLVVKAINDKWSINFIPQFGLGLRARLPNKKNK